MRREIPQVSTRVDKSASLQVYKWTSQQAADESRYRPGQASTWRVYLAHNSTYTYELVRTSWPCLCRITGAGMAYQCSETVGLMQPKGQWQGDFCPFCIACAIPSIIIKMLIMP